MATPGDRYAAGVATLKSITGSSGEAMVESLKDITPDLASWIVAIAYGDVISLPGLDKPVRQVATIAALMALGTVAAQLKVHSMVL